MKSPELAEIDASMQAIVRRAYDLGRSEALKQVVDVLSADCAVADQLALSAPDESASSLAETEMSEPHSAEKAPWWAWPVR